MKKLVRILAWVVSITLALLILLALGLQLFFPVEKARQYAEEKGSAALERPVKIESAEISFWGGLGIKLHNVSIENQAEFGDGKLLDARFVDAKMALWPLLFGDYQVEKLIIEQPQINLLKKADGLNNYTFKKLEEKAPPQVAEKTSAETKAALATVTFDRLEINRGELSYTDDSSGTNFALSGFELNTELTLDELKKYHSKGEVGIEKISTAMDLPIPQASYSLNYEAIYDPALGDLRLEQAKLGFNQIDFNITGKINSVLDSMNMIINVKGERNNVNEYLALVPPEKLTALEKFTLDGEIELDADIDYDSRGEGSFDYYGNIVISSIKAKYADVPGSLEIEKGFVDFKEDNIRINIEQGYFDQKPFKAHTFINDFEHPQLTGEIAGTVNLAYINPFINKKRDHNLAGLADVDLKIYGPMTQYDSLNFSGTLKVNGASYSSSILHEPIDSLGLDLYFDNNLIRVNNLLAVSKSARLAFSGRLNDVTSYVLADSLSAKKIKPRIDGKLTGQVDLASLERLLPPKGDPTLSGNMEFDLKVIGPILDYKNLSPSGEIKIVNAAYNDSLLSEPIKSFNAHMVSANDTITIHNMEVKFLSSDVSFSGKLSNPFPYLLPFEGIDRSKLEKPYFTFDLSAHRFDTDKLFPEAVPGSEANRAELAMDSVSTVILPDIDGKGTFKIDTLIYSKVQFTSINGDVKIYDKKIECTNVSGMAYTGTVTGNTTIDLNDFNKPQYTGTFKATQIEANDFVSRFSKFSDIVYGKIDMEGTFSAAGWEPKEFLNSLTMNSTSNMKSGKLKTGGETFKQVNALADKLKKDLGQEQLLRDLRTAIIVKGGKVALDKLKTRLGSLGDLELDGFYGFDGVIDYTGSLLLTRENTKELTSKDLLSSLFSENSVERMKLPIKVGGTIDKPKFEIDYNDLLKNAGKNLKDDIGSKIGDFFK